MKLFNSVCHYVIGLLGILFISIVPEVLLTHGVVSPALFASEYVTFIRSLFDENTWVYQYKDYEVSVVSFLWEPYLYSMKILVGAIFFGFLVAFILAVLTMNMPSVIKQLIKRTLQFLEVVPDILFLFLVQLLIVLIYKQTGALLMEFTRFEKEIYVFPILVLSILPAISFYRVMVMYIEEETSKPYVEFANSKGLQHVLIILNHIIRNVAPSVFHYSKVIIWGALSSLFVIEWLLDINGVFYFVFHDFRPIVSAVSLWFVFTPSYLIYSVVETILQTKKTNPITKKDYKNRTIKGSLTTLFKVFMTLFSIKNINTSRILKRLKPVIIVANCLQLGKETAKQMIPYFKNVKFVIGFVFLSSLILYSLIYSVLTDSYIEQKMFLYNEQGQIVSVSPHPPSQDFLLGTTGLGYNIYDMIVVGAKSTLLFGAGIAGLRILLGLLLAIPFGYFIHGRWRVFIEKWVESLHFVPLTIVAYMLLKPILWGEKGEWDYSYAERVWIEVAILTLLVAPFLMTQIGSDIKLLLRNTYIDSARLLGGSHSHILIKHILPQLGPRLTILFGQQFMQVMLLFMHLGLFQLFFGGTYIYLPDPPKSVSNEWSGMIGDAKNTLATGPWWVIIPVLIAFIVAILAMQTMLKGMQEVMQAKIGVKILDRKSKWKSHSKREEETDRSQPQQVGFNLLTQQQVKMNKSL
ncbi:ABC transporter permease subunit [Bacillus salitolerans]|uniref:ABC transporter permease subunit n=1 Tax=Bacillus salitolerans TaxID=1437434 RepID=A0ABW4LUB7_9BACI